MATIFVVWQLQFVFVLISGFSIQTIHLNVVMYLMARYTVHRQIVSGSCRTSQDIPVDLIQHAPVETAGAKNISEQKNDAHSNESTQHESKLNLDSIGNNDSTNINDNFTITINPAHAHDVQVDAIESDAVDIDPGVYDDCKNDKPEVVRWDKLLFYYLFGVALTGAAFGLSYDYEYNKYQLLCAYIHFCGEMTIASYFLYKPKTAKLMCKIIHVIMLSQAFILLPLVPLAQISKAFSFTFLFSDIYGMLASMVVTMNPYAPQSLRSVAFGVGFHFVGVTMSLCHLPMKMYFNALLPQTGYVWLLIGLALPIQLWFSKHFLQSKYNYLSANNIRYFNSKHEKLHKYGPAFGSIFLATRCSFMALTRTTEDEDNLFAYPPASYAIAILAYPICSVSLMTAAYLWTKGRAMRIKKGPKE